MIGRVLRPAVRTRTNSKATSTRRVRRHVGLAVGAIGLLAVIPACSSRPIDGTLSSPTSTSTSAVVPTSSSVTVPNGSAAAVASCEADAKVVDVALQAYMARKGSYPTPPSPWSAATYTANYEPLTSASDGGPYMSTPPRTISYVIEYDSAGHIWVAPPGSYGVYNRGQDFDANPDICDAAVR